MKRLRDINTGEVYGWNAEMAKLPYLVEFDDENPDDAWTGPAQPTEPLVSSPSVGVSEDPDEAVRLAIEKAAAEAVAVLQPPVDPFAPSKPIEEMSPEEMDAEIARLEALEQQKTAEDIPAAPKPAPKPKK